MNRKGNPRTLRASQPQNLNALRSGVYSQRARTPREQEIKNELLEAQVATPIDAIGAAEIASILAIIEAADSDLAERGIVKKNGEPRSLLEYRLRYSNRLERWLRQYGATPKSRVELASQLGQSGATRALLEAEVAEGKRLLQSSSAAEPPPVGPSEAKD
jgi:hypothetical protein